MNQPLKTLGFLPLFPFFFSRYKKLKKDFPKVKDTLTTLQEIADNNLSISRYGDGELNLISGKNIGFQEINDKLAIRLQEIINNPSEKCLVAIPDVFSGLSRFKLEAKFFWLFTIIKNWETWKKLLGKYNYSDSLCSRFYMDLKPSDTSQAIVDAWRKIWDKRDVVIIEGENTKMGIGNDLFSNTKSLSRIICPSKNAFDKYDRILAEAEKLDKKTLILIALGPTATVLAYDLAEKGYQALDTGHLDLEYCWMKMGAKDKVPIAGRYVNEISNKEVEEITDSDYLSQIICEIR